MRELASLLSHESKSTSPSVIINCMTPGACKSDFDRESTGFARVMGNFMAAMLARTTEEGSRTLVAGLAAGEESQGGYMADCKIHPYVLSSLPILFELSMRDADNANRPGPMVIGSDGAALQKKVWEQLVGQLETVQPGISQNI